jgi:DNA-binding beta-propeller fold protein YncE
VTITRPREDFSLMRPLVVIALVAGLCTSCAESTPDLPFQTESTTRSSNDFAKAKPFQLAVAEYKDNSVQIFDRKYQITRTITSGISGPVHIWLDPKTGALYVANSNAGTVTEYAEASSSPEFTYSNGLSCPGGVTTDKSGNVYVSDFCTNEIGEYAQGTNKMFEECGTGAGSPAGLIIDSSGDLIFAEQFQIAIFANHTGARSPLAGCDGPGSVFGGMCSVNSVVLDSSSNIIAADQGGCSVPFIPPQIDIIPPPYKYISQVWRGFSGPTGVALNFRQNRLFVADYGGSTVDVVTYPGDKVVTTLGPSSGVTSPFGVAVYPSVPDN